MPNRRVVRFVVTSHHPEMHGEFSGHSGDGLVFVACVMNEPAKGFVGIAVFLNPHPGALDEDTAKWRSARFEDGAVSGRLARLMNGWSKPHVFGELRFITEPLRVEDFRGELRSDGLANAWVRSEKFACSADWFFTEGVFDFLFGELELFGDEAKFLKQGVETESQGI